MAAVRRIVPFAASVALAALVVAAAGCGASRSSSRAASAAGTGATAGAGAGGGDGGGGGGATVVRVVDGDTIVVQINGKSERVRFIGIDTPESVKPGTPVQCFAHEASDHTKQLLPSGSSVRLERDVEARDRYDRLLAYVYRADGLFVNLALVHDGFAVTDTIPPNVAHAGEFVRAAADARRANRGLWSRCGDDVPKHPSPPLPSGG